ncbi:helix-turn-helix domain-containing protein [Streptomyces sp. NPDC093109]|uniref:helix-turn-helix domain-containing protein n=1 Tax=Streptomyces sp. NPDC093109 TaxID=3154977 RepID=UPI00344B3C66
MRGRPGAADRSSSSGTRNGPGEDPDEFLRLVGRLARRPDADARQVLDWLQRRLGAEIALVGRGHTVELATAAFPTGILGTLAPLLTRLADGRLASAATEVGTVRIRLEGVGSGTPRRVLVLAGPDPLSPRDTTAAAHTGHVLTLLHRAEATDTVLRAYQQKAHQLRVALFMALMAGDTVLARRMTTGAVPELLDSDRLRLFLLRCAPGDRDRLTRAHQDASGYHGRGMMVRCPVYDEHLICLIPETGTEAGTGTETEERPELDRLLRELVEEIPGYALGISDAHPLHATAVAYEQARHALAVAGNIPGRVASYRGREPLERVLPHAAAADWARHFLRPLRLLPRLAAESTHLALSFPRSGVADLLGISRNTVTAHLRRAEEALGLDLRDVRSRATLALALAIDARPDAAHQDAVGADAARAGSGPYEESGDPERSPTAACPLLSGPEAVSWAHRFLEPLADGRHERVRGTLRVWIESNADTRRAAQRLGGSRTTVTARLRTAERLLGRDLTRTAAGVHDLVYALHIADRIPLCPPAAPASVTTHP